MDYIWKWEMVFNSCETASNIIVDAKGNIIFYYNQYVDNILRERKLGKLLSLSPTGEENWEFSFPDYNYLYFTGKIAFEGKNIYVIADSNQNFDSGFERGLYMFSINGNFIQNYASTDIANIPKISGVNKSNYLENKDIIKELEKKLNKKINTMATYESRIYYIICYKDNIKLTCIESGKTD